MKSMELKYEEYWDSFNVELYALVKQVKKNKVEWED